MDGVFVAAQNVDGVAADAQARAGNETLVDGIADGCVGRSRALGPHIALGGEACQQIGFGGLGGQQRAPGNRFLYGLQVFGAGVQKEMDVRVDEAGEQSGVAEIEDPSALRMLNRDADSADAVALDQDFARLKESASVHLEQARGVEDDGRCIGLLRGGEWRSYRAKQNAANHGT
jgi:hypothetical protein